MIAFYDPGKVEHFSEVFEKTRAEAALAAGIFHREEVPIEAVKEHMRDKDGTNSGFDIELINHIRDNVSIPVIASSGAGKVEHFSEVFAKTKAEAALAAGIFHRREIPIEAVKEHMRDEGIETR